jgi:hypothetical protein
MDWTCAQGRVLYFNLELDRASCLDRFRDVHEALGWAPSNLGNIDGNLRGRSVPMDKLALKLIRRAGKKGYIAVVKDPKYKENGTSRTNLWLIGVSVFIKSTS